MHKKYFKNMEGYLGLFLILFIFLGYAFNLKTTTWLHNTQKYIYTIHEDLWLMQAVLKH